MKVCTLPYAKRLFGFPRALLKAWGCQAVAARVLSVGLAAGAVAACSTPGPEERREIASAVAREAGWQRLDLDTGGFVLAAFVPPRPARARRLSIYVEGDGTAWVDGTTPSFDPTPVDPVALRLALEHPTASVAYLARPCQFVAGGARKGCNVRFWTSHRFSREVVEATDRAVESLKQRFGAQELELIGYSGGGAVAALVAARRPDVARLLTVAGNLDPVQWADLHHASPLSGSLNPIDAAPALVDVPQMHFVGGRDDNVPPAVAGSFRARFPASPPPVRVVDEFDHACCWVQGWRRLYEGAANRP